MQPLTSDDPAAIGGYRLEARLGSGGMGRVYLAFTPAGRPVALKVVRSDLGDDQDFRIRFGQEIQAARRVRGLYTAELIDADPAATPPWLVTAYVPGPSVEEVIDRDGPMPEAMVFRLIAGVAEALQAIHAAGVIHRDLKPSNVLLAQDGPRVIDFGIARALAATPVTRTGASMGSPDYMSPELLLNRPVTPAIDVFALGSLAAFAAVGRLPFGRGHITDVAHRVVHEPPDLAGCPAGLVTLIEACLQKEPQARPAPGQIIEFCVARAALLGDSGQPRPAPVPFPPAARPRPPGGRPARRRSCSTGPGWPARAGREGAASRSSPCWRSSPARRSPPPRCSSRSRPPGIPAPAAPSPAAPPPPRRSVAARAPVAPLPVVLLSQGRPVTASSVQPGSTWVAANAVDGNTGTRWSSNFSDPQWIEVDLGAAHPLTKVVLDWETAYAVAFQIQVSDDGTTWTDIYSTTTGTGGSQTCRSAAPAATSGCTAPSGPPRGGTRCGNSKSSGVDHGRRATRRTGGSQGPFGRKECEFSAVGAQLLARDRAQVDLVRAVGQVQGPQVGPRLGQRGVGRDAGPAVDLDRPVEDVAAARGAATLIAAISVRAPLAPTLSISQAALSTSSRACSIASRDSAIHSWTTPCRAIVDPKVERDDARAHISSSARSATPRLRMQWWMRPGPSRAWAIMKPPPCGPSRFAAGTRTSS